MKTTAHRSAVGKGPSAGDHGAADIAAVTRQPSRSHVRELRPQPVSSSVDALDLGTEPSRANADAPGDSRTGDHAPRRPFTASSAWQPLAVEPAATRRPRPTWLIPLMGSPRSVSLPLWLVGVTVALLLSLLSLLAAAFATYSPPLP